MVYEERVYLIGATGNIGKPLVHKLLTNPKIALTLYTRTPSKVQEIFGSDLPQGKVTVIEGDYENQKPFQESITGHTRLFLLLTPSNESPRIAREFAEAAYSAGVQQIVVISGIVASLPWRLTMYTEITQKLEQDLLNIPKRKAIVSLRPAYFMTNIFAGADITSIKTANMFADIRTEDQTRPWISPKDIGELSANILQDPIKKHGDAVYEMIGDPKTPVEEAKSLSRVLGREIVYKKISEEQFYENMAKYMPHRVAFMFMQMATLLTQKRTPGLSVLLGRAPQTLEEWVEENKAAFL
ncbi:hypothetical protein INT45_008546 [Circinella minor]|uniref:NAD(P)-binding domain-containing protein n=1 Tax=Circinella minor TaxID=1195481 RepID=A0A8H7VMC9_9FUNG|nr:hypothetical protein INT45_008546 [Circinella minor]